VAYFPWSFAWCSPHGWCYLFSQIVNNLMILVERIRTNYWLWSTEFHNLSQYNRTLEVAGKGYFPKKLSRSEWYQLVPISPQEQEVVFNLSKFGQSVFSRGDMVQIWPNIASFGACLSCVVCRMCIHHTHPTWMSCAGYAQHFRAQDSAWGLQGTCICTGIRSMHAGKRRRLSVKHDIFLRSQLIFVNKVCHRKGD
jgi:hypothetical protein